MDGYLEQARKNKEVLNKEDEDQLVDVKKEVEEEAPASSEISMKQEEVEEQESEEDNQGSPYPNKAPTITQPPSLDIQEVKATNKSTEKRIVTKIPMTTFKKRSTVNNPTPDPASKLKQATYKRKLAEERPKQGTIDESSPPLRSFLLTNWKKRNKVKNNMSS
ncbi:hypothetical protein AHAS_Ahas11G0202300 [Arachis hypogaea]